jgi:hypothetical protein
MADLPRIRNFAFTGYKCNEKKNDTCTVKCILCNDNKCISDKRGTTSNFVKHIERKHVDRYVQYCIEMCCSVASPEFCCRGHGRPGVRPWTNDVIRVGPQ